MIKWKNHPNEPVPTRKDVLVRGFSYEDKDGEIHFRFFITKFDRPYDDYPQKYSKDFYRILDREDGWQDVTKEFEWCELK
jgi:hypothetical protein